MWFDKLTTNGIAQLSGQLKRSVNDPLQLFVIRLNQRALPF
jgi:hypothetical protein